MRYSCIHRRRSLYPVRMMCDALKVSASGYYDWQGRPESPALLMIGNSPRPSDKYTQRVTAPTAVHGYTRSSTPQDIPVVGLKLPV